MFLDKSRNIQQVVDVSIATSLFSTDFITVYLVPYDIIGYGSLAQ